jgi:hypothetical protein
MSAQRTIKIKREKKLNAFEAKEVLEFGIINSVGINVSIFDSSGVKELSFYSISVLHDFLNHNPEIAYILDFPMDYTQVKKKKWYQEARKNKGKIPPGHKAQRISFADTKSQQQREEGEYLVGQIEKAMIEVVFDDDYGSARKHVLTVQELATYLKRHPQLAEKLGYVPKK